MKGKSHHTGGTCAQNAITSIQQPHGHIENKTTSHKLCTLDKHEHKHRR